MYWINFLTYFLIKDIVGGAPSKEEGVNVVINNL
jgi:hypothetical protein